MTRTTNARLAGSTFLIYIAVGITGLLLSSRVTSGAEDTAAKLASMARNAPVMQVSVLLTLLQAGFALVLAVTIHALTRDRDRDLALMAMCCRVGEGIVIVVAPLLTLALLSIAGAATSAVGADAAAENALGALVLKIEASTGIVAAICFAVGSTIYCYLFLRARSIPVILAWLGVVSSILLVVVLPLQLAGFVKEGLLAQLVWMPMLVFEVALAIRLLTRGVGIPSAAYSNNNSTGVMNNS